MPIVGVGYYFFCQQQMPGTVVSTGHTLKHNTAAFSASGHRIERGGRRGEMQKRTRRKTGKKNEREQETDCVGRNRGNMREEEGGERGRNKG